MDVPRGDTAGLDRRQLLKAGAWAVPVIVLASGTPAAAASEPIEPSEITLDAHCASTSGDETEHGFTITNTSTQSATVVVGFTAQAWGAIITTAAENVISATSDPDAEYPVTATGGGEILDGLTYQTLWETIRYIEELDGHTAHREGEAVFVLPPGASVTFGQINGNVRGEPLIVARVANINIVGVIGQIAAFSFEVGGACGVTVP